MVKRKPIAASLIGLGMIWLIGAAWIHLTMTAITEPVLPLPAYFSFLFAPPFLLIVSAVVWLVHASRIAKVCCLAACALLIWSLGSELFSMVLGFFGAPQPLQPSHDIVDYIVATVIGVFIICTAIAAMALLRSLIKPFSQALQPTAGRSDD